jgi:hypothetical protein
MTNQVNETKSQTYLNHNPIINYFASNHLIGFSSLFQKTQNCSVCDKNFINGKSRPPSAGDPTGQGQLSQKRE